MRIDKRIPTNNLAQAEAALKAAESRRSIALLQMERAEKLVSDNTITDSDFEETALALSEAEAQRVRARVDMENARIALGDTDVLAPIDGTIIERNVEPGQVISLADPGRRGRHPAAAHGRSAPGAGPHPG